MSRSASRVSRAALPLALAVAFTVSATPGEMFPIDIVLRTDGSVLCVNHIDLDGNPWFIADIASIQKGITNPPRSLAVVNGDQAVVLGVHVLPNHRIDRVGSRRIAEETVSPVRGCVSAGAISASGVSTNARFASSA